MNVDIRVSFRAATARAVSGRFRNRLDPLITKTNILPGDSAGSRDEERAIVPREK